MSNEKRTQLEAYARKEELKLEHSTAPVSDSSLTKDRLILQKDIREGCLVRLVALIEKIEASDFSDDSEWLLLGVISDLSHENILDYRDQFSIQTYEALWQKIHELKIALEKKGIYREEKIQKKLIDLDGKLEKNRMRVLYIFDPITLRTQIYDEFRKKRKALRDAAATKEQIQALIDETREKLILSVELISHLQLSFSQAYQELFPRLATKIQDEAGSGNRYPQLDFLDVLHSFETGLVDYGITTNAHRNNIVDHLMLLTDNHNHISQYLESFTKTLDGKEFFRTYTEFYLGKRLEPTGEVNLILDPPYRDLTIECEADEDYFILRFRGENRAPDDSGGMNSGSFAIPDGQGQIAFLPVSFIRGFSESQYIKHEDAHSLQRQYQKSELTGQQSAEMLAANREKWVGVFGISYEEAYGEAFDQYDWRKKSQVYLARTLNKAILRARGELQAFTRDGTEVKDMAHYLTESGDGALYDYLNTGEMTAWIERDFGQSSGFDIKLVEQDILEARAVYSSFLSDALSVVENYLRVLGNSHDVRETASIVIRFTTIDELKWLVNLLQERTAEALTYDPAEKVVELLGETDESLGYEFIKILTKWGTEIEKIKSHGMSEKSFDYIIGYMRWNNFYLDGVSVKALSNPESLLIVDKPSIMLRLKSKYHFLRLCKLLGLIGPNQSLQDMVSRLDSRENIDRGYQYHGQVIHNVPTNILGLSLTSNLEGYIDGSIDVSFNFDLETFHLMLNQMGLFC